MSLVEPTARIDQERPTGEVFTRRWIVEMMLDLAGYTPDIDLASMKAVEPACGAGAFLGPMVERLSASCRAHGRPITDARQALVALDLELDNVNHSRNVVHDALIDGGWTPKDAGSLARTWVTHSDYLLEGAPRLTLVDQAGTCGADFVIGNPPYIRPEDVPSDLYQAYRRAWPTMTGRADVYVGFFEAGLRSLRPGGVLTFICADRWMRNQYGRELRSLISDGYCMQTLISMHDVDAFEIPVSAYPAITVIRRGVQADVTITDATAGFGKDDGRRLVAWALGNRHQVQAANFRGTRLGHWFAGGESWPGGDPKTIEMVESLNARFAPIEDPGTGTKVGIGIATGNDRLFVTTDPDLVEHERLLPLAVSADGTSGTLRWSGHFLVNPWEEDGSLVDLAKYPRLRKYLELHGGGAGEAPRRQTFGRELVPDDRQGVLGPDGHAKTAFPRHEDDDPSGAGLGNPLPPPQPVLDHVGEVGSGNSRRSPHVPGRRGLRQRLLRQDAWWNTAVPGAVSPADPRTQS